MEEASLLLTISVPATDEVSVELAVAELDGLPEGLPDGLAEELIRALLPVLVKVV